MTLRILVAEARQEISSFNPVPSEVADFDIFRGQALLDYNRTADSCIRGAMNVFEARGAVELLPTYGAKACSAGPLSAEGWNRISGEMLAAIAEQAPHCDAVFFSMHGAMGAVNELDPEGYLLQETRRLVGNKPIVISLDLHGILTDRMLEHCDGLAVYQTYPHQDFTDTGERAARVLLRIVDEGAKPVVAKVVVPALVRGPELITQTGLYGGIIRQAQALEQMPQVLAGAFMIGNPFTDVPELASMAIVCTDGDEALAREGALKMAGDFWADRAKMRATLDPLDAAIDDAIAQEGPVTFTDAADAPSSGASGDGNAILRGLVARQFPKRALLPIVDAPAVAAAHAAGVGARITVPLGGSKDPTRFPPLPLEVEVELLGNGRYTMEVNGTPASVGPTAVLRHDTPEGSITLIAVSRAIQMMDRSLYRAHGRDPAAHDVVVVKSPGAYARFFTYARRNFTVDVPGATTANLPLLGHTVCARPMYPLDPDVTFSPQVKLFRH